MALFYGYKRLTKADDWQGLAGADKWVPTRSAYELAHSWQPAGGLPPSIARAFGQGTDDVLKGICLDYCLVEKPVFLDTNAAPSMTDLMAYARNANGDRVVVAVEGKADEPFGSPVWRWARGDARDVRLEDEVRATRCRRLKFLSTHLGKPISTESKLRYQLLHRTVSAVLEAQLHGAVAAVVVVHAFGSLCPENFSDFETFLSHLSSIRPVPGFVVGPLQLGEGRDIPTLFLWQQDAVSVAG